MRAGSAIRSTGGAFIKCASGGRQDGKWKGAYGLSVGVGAGAVYSIDAKNNGKILCGGYFTTHYKKTKTSPIIKNVKSVIRLRNDGDVDSTLSLNVNLTNGSGVGTCNSIASLSTREIVCAGFIF